jgi:hypothetical protein
MLVTFGVLLAAGPVLRAEEGREQAIAMLKQVGGSYTTDDEAPGKPIVGVKLSGCRRFVDGHLAAIKGLSELKKLDLTFLNALTDGALDHIKGLTKLEEIKLNSTKVTDAGLAKLKGLTNLKRLELNETKVTLEGIKDLQKTLPNTFIRK